MPSSRGCRASRSCYDGATWGELVRRRPRRATGACRAPATSPPCTAIARQARAGARPRRAVLAARLAARLRGPADAGWLNRRAVEERLEAASDARAGPVALLLGDLDGLKAISDALATTPATRALRGDRRRAARRASAGDPRDRARRGSAATSSAVPPRDRDDRRRRQEFARPRLGARSSRGAPPASTWCSSGRRRRARPAAGGRRCCCGRRRRAVTGTRVGGDCVRLADRPPVRRCAAPALTRRGHARATRSPCCGADATTAVAWLARRGPRACRRRAGGEAVAEPGSEALDPRRSARMVTEDGAALRDRAPSIDAPRRAGHRAVARRSTTSTRSTPFTGARPRAQDGDVFRRRRLPPGADGGDRRALRDRPQPGARRRGRRTPALELFGDASTAADGLGRAARCARWSRGALRRAARSAGSGSR